LDLVDLLDEDNLPATYSGDEKTVEICRAFYINPKVLFLVNPTLV